jgi:hypothetical protein
VLYPHRLGFSTFASSFALGVIIAAVPAKASDAFPPLTPEEIQMTSEPQAPGAAAVILYRKVERDDSALTGHENNYFRIKILKEEGRKFADVEIPFIRGNESIVKIQARTIRPDNSVVDFDGKVYEKTLVKARGFKYLAKTFTLAEVQVGSIIEYSYTNDFAEHLIFDSHWILSDELFTRHGVFSLKPYSSPYQHLSVRWSWQRLPAGTPKPTEGPDAIVRLEASNIPAFQAEDFMPPENELKARVDFIYYEESARDAEQFWKDRGKRLNGALENFVGKRKAMEQAVAGIVSAGDTPEIKLQKIYSRVQQFRNTSFEVNKTEQEQKRAKEKDVDNVEDLWKRGYGTGEQLTWLFLALTRAAGIEAYGVWASDRYHYFFSPTTMDSSKLNSHLVLAKVNGKDLYLDPGTAFTPFGLLPWPETGVPGLRLDKNGPSWVETTLPQSSASRIERKANLKLTDTGDLEGRLAVTFTGLLALQRRLEEINEDDATRKKFLEDEAQQFIPVGSQADLVNKPEWTSSTVPLVAEFDIKVPGWAAQAGRRVLLPVGLFSASEKHLFDHAFRAHPIYFEFPFEKVDDITIEPPLGWLVASLPPAQTRDLKAVSYTLNAENGKGVLHLSRKLRVDIFLLDSKDYSVLRSFFQAVRTGDDEQIVLQPGATTANN